MKDDSGFSLIEMLVAVMIFAAVSAAGVGVCAGFQKGQVSIFTADALTSRLQTTLATLREDMESIADRPVRGAYGGMEPAFGRNGGKDPGMSGLRLVRTGAMVVEDGRPTRALQLVEYRLVDDALVRRTYNRPDRTPETPYHDTVLLTGVKGLSIRYQKDTVWLQDWQPALYGEGTGAPAGGGYMPDLVELTLDMADTGSLRSLFVLTGQAS